MARRHPVVAIVAPEYPPATGGMERYASEIALGLKSRGFDLVVFTRTSTDAASDEAFPTVRGLTGVWASDERTIANWPGGVGVWHVMNGAWSWLAVRRENVIISIHGNDFLNPNPVAGFGLKKRFRLPFGSRLDFYLAKWRTRRVMQQAFPLARHIIANSRFVEEVFLDINPRCRGKTSVGYVGVAEIFFGLPVVPQRKRNCFRLITVCRLSEARKNVDLMLRALGELKDQYSFTYTIVGEGDLRNSLERLSNELGLAERVTFPGRLPDPELVDLLRESDLFIFVDEPTVPAVVAALSRFFRGEISFDREACRSFAQNFTWNRVVEHVVGCYSSLLERVPALD